MTVTLKNKLYNQSDVKEINSYWQLFAISLHTCTSYKQLE